MLLKQIKSLLPKRLAVGVALKTPVSQHQLSRLRGFRKLIRSVNLSKAAKFSLGVSLAIYFSGYQPVLSIPPLRQSVAQAESTQEQLIDSLHLSQPFQLPHPGYLTTRFSSWHPGIDIATGLGMPVHPLTPGKIAEVTYGYFGLGHYIVIEHELGFKSTYGHMGRIFVKAGDTVSLDSTLGEVGMTGHTSGPHTHLELTKDSKYIDPQSVLPSLQDWPQYAGQAPKGQGQLEQQPTPSPKQPERSKIEPENTSALKGILNLQKLEKSTPQTKPNNLNLLDYLSL